MARGVRNDRRPWARAAWTLLGITLTITAQLVSPVVKGTPVEASTPTIPGLTVIQGAPNHIIEVDCGALEEGFQRYFVPYTITDGSTFDTLQVRGLSTCNSKSHGKYNSFISGSTCFGSVGSWCGAGIYGFNQGTLDQASLLRNTRYQLFTQQDRVIEIIFYFALDRRYPPDVWVPKTQTISGTSGIAITPSLAYSIDGPSTPSFSISPALPAGLTIDPVTGVISGTPTVTHPTTTHTVTATMGSDAPTATVTVSVGTHRVGFHANAPTSPFASNIPPAQIATEDGDAITLPAGPTRSNHGFNGWFTSPTDPTSLVGQPGEAYTPTASITLYAQWTPPYTIAFDSQGGSSRSSATVVPGATLTFPSNPTKSGTTFAGWFDAPSGGSLVAAPFTPSGSMTLYAQWTATRTLSLGGGSLPSGTPTTEVINLSTSPTITLPTPTRSGYRFLGWYSSSSGGTRYGGGGDSYTLTRNTTIYARWLSLRRVDFDPSGGTIGDVRCQVVSAFCRLWWAPGDPALVLPDITSNSGLTFDGWFTSSSGGTFIGRGGDTVSNPTSGTTYRAQWTGVKTLEANGGMLTSTTVSAKSGANFKVPIPHLPGRAFDGWFNAPSGGSLVTDRGRDQLGMFRSETWHAQWGEYPGAPTLETATLSEDRRTITLRFSGDVQALYGNTLLCQDFVLVSTHTAFNTGPRTCAVDGSDASQVTITPAVLTGLEEGAPDLTVAYAGRSLAAADDATQFVHQTVPLAVGGIVVSPTAPTGLSAEPGDGEVTLRWNPPLSDGGAEILAYTVTGTSSGREPVTCTTAETTCVIDGLRNGRRYVFTVVATNTKGDSAPSGPAAARPSGRTWIPTPEAAAPTLPPASGEAQREGRGAVRITPVAEAPGRLRFAAIETDGEEGDGDGTGAADSGPRQLAAVSFIGDAASDTTRGLISRPDRTVVCEVCADLAAGTELEVWAFSTPRRITTAIVGDDGCAEFIVPLADPIDGEGAIEPGQHTLQVVLPLEDGRLAVNVAVTIPEPPTVVADGSDRWVPTPQGQQPLLHPPAAEMQREGGQPTALTPMSESDGEIAYVDADGMLSIAFTGDPMTSTRRGLVATRDGMVRCEVCSLDLPEGAVVEVWAFSTARLVAAAAVDARGCVDFMVPLLSPLDGGAAIASGQHTLQVILPLADGSGRLAVNVGVTVGGLAPGSLPAGEGTPTGAAPMGGALAAAFLGLLAGLRRRGGTQGAAGSS